MEDDFSISFIAQRQTPVLMQTGNLIQTLGMCLMYGTTTQAAAIRLKLEENSRNGNHRSSDLGSELDRIANDGLDAFTNANEFLNTIRYTASSIARPGGPLETLQADFGKPEAQRNNKRLLDRIEREVNNCVDSGTDLAAKFESWQTETKILQQALKTEHTRAAQVVEQTRRDINARTHEVEIAQDELKDAEIKELAAQEKHVQNLNRQHDISLGAIHVPQSDNMMQYLYCAASVAKLGWSWYSTKAAASVVHDTQKEFERKKRAADDYRLSLQNAEASLGSQNRKKLQLDEFTDALKLTLTALNTLGQQVRSMLVEFNQMKVLMKKLLDRHRDGLIEIGEDPENANAIDIKQFSNDALEMRRWAIMIEHLAWLYAEIIRQVMIQGFENIQRMPQPSGTVDESQPFLEKTNSRSVLYLQGNNSTCSVISTQVDKSFRGSYERLEQPGMANSNDTPQASRPRVQEIMPNEKPKKRSIFSRRSKRVIL